MSHDEPRTPLDVDRLIEALHSLHMPMSWRWWDRETGDTSGTSVEFAAAIVREDTRLALLSESQDPEEGASR